MTEKVFLNDGLVGIGEAGISVSDGGFLYGAGLFETMRCCNGVVFRLDDHLDRLLESAKALAIPVENCYDRKYISDAIYEVLKANKLTEARLRLTVTSGTMSGEDELVPTLLVTATKMHGYPDEYYKNGVLVVLCPYRQNPTNPTCGHKTINYFPRMLGLNFARARRATEALWFTVDNRLAEGCISNVFLVKDSKLYTPAVETGILKGIARKTVFEIAAENSIEVIEKDLYIDDCLGADEIFLTNVIMQVLPVSKVEKHEVGKGKVGPVTEGLRKSFDEFVKAECGIKK